jgi:hypothetical protein
MGILDSVLGSKKPKSNLVEGVISMRQQGAPDAAIAQQMQAQGISLPQIQDAMTQADIKMRVGGSPMGPPGAPPGMGPPGQSEMQQMGPPGQPEMAPPMGMPGMGGMGMGAPQEPSGPSSEELIERIIDEKWHTMQDKFDKFEDSKSEILRQLQDLRDNLNDLRVKYAQLQEDSVVKIEEYNKELEGVGSQIKAMQRVMQNIIPVFAENVRQLNDIVVELKGAPSSPASPPVGLQMPAPPRPGPMMPGALKKPSEADEEPLFR